jgi:glyoxylase-like metal-dependent hydrolase (beta-lactamase superfamily II)
MKRFIMDEWFTIEKIDNETYAISEYGHWEKVHSYLLIGKTSALLIDTGLGIGNIKKEVDKLTELPVVVVTTHVHWDHIGGHRLFNDIYVHKDEVEWLKNGIGIPPSVIKKNVMAEPFSKNPPVEFNIEDYKVYTGEPTKVLNDKDIIDIGLRKVRVIHTPGHSPGRICLFEEERGYLYAGDLIYKGTLYAFYPSTDPILFKESVDKISNFKGITKILPAHNELNVQVELISSIKNAFKDIEDKDMLKQGNGIFDFSDFRIHI